MSGAGLKMVVHMGEGARVGGRLAGDAVTGMAAEAGVDAAVLLRGVEGFGLRHALRTDRMLSLSEDLPLLLVAVGGAPVVSRLAREVAAALERGLVTLERVALQGGGPSSPAPGGADVKLTVYCGRGEPRSGPSVPVAVARAMRDAGLAGAIALAGVDGAIAGRRGRARALSRNRDVPSMVIAVGSPGAARTALERAREVAGPHHRATLERVGLLRRDGAALGPLPPVPPSDAAGLGLWQRITVIAGEADGPGGAAFHAALIRALREAGASGASALRGTVGHSGEGSPHADRLLDVRRRGPVLVSVVERPDAVGRLWPVVERATAVTGLVTCELIPAARAGAGGDRTVGGLDLAAAG